jgi:hypothetical protein
LPGERQATEPVVMPSRIDRQVPSQVSPSIHGKEGFNPSTLHEAGVAAADGVGTKGCRGWLVASGPHANSVACVIDRKCNLDAKFIG